MKKTPQESDKCGDDYAKRGLVSHGLGSLFIKWHEWFTCCDHLNRKLGKLKEMAGKKKEETFNY